MFVRRPRTVEAAARAEAERRDLGMAGALPLLRLRRPSDEMTGGPFDYDSFIDQFWRERREIVSDGFDRSLAGIAEMLPGMEIEAFPSGSEAWSWVIPKKWSVTAASIRAGGRTLVDLKDHPLHVISYSIPFRGVVSREEILRHLHTRPERPDDIPFEYSYYEARWGFCLPHRRLSEFTSDSYEVEIDSRFEEGALKVGSLLVPGRRDEEVVVMAHLCHPAMAEDDLSGVAVLVALARRALAAPRARRYSVRFLLFPETIGSIAWLSRHEDLIPRIRYGLFLEMLGHDDRLSLQRSRQGDVAIDRAALVALKETGRPFRVGAFREVIGNDEKIFNGPGVDIPSISLSRSAFWGRGEWPYPEYHSSADTPEIVSAERLREAEAVAGRIIEVLDLDRSLAARTKGPICLSRLGIWEDWRTNREVSRKQWDLFYYLHEPRKTALDMAYELDLPLPALAGWIDRLVESGAAAWRDP